MQTCVREMTWSNACLHALGVDCVTDKLAQYAATGRGARRGAVVYGDLRQFVEEDGVMSTP